MCYVGLLKRFVPFLLTFAAGLFIASFFVSIAIPEASWRSRRGFNRFQEMQRLQVENDNVRQENLRLKMENDALRRNAEDWDRDVLPLVPPVDFEEHHPPSPPKRPKQPRFE
jgi:hypothetical protein